MIHPVLLALALGAHVGLQSMALQLTDLPRGTQQLSGQFFSNAQAAARDHVTVQLYQQHGRLMSYEDTFARPLINGLPMHGLTGAGSEVTKFRDVAGARWYFRREEDAIHHGSVLGTTTAGSPVGDGYHHFPFQPLPVAVVGDQDAGFTATSGGDEFAYVTRVLVFQQGRYVVVLRLIGLDGEVPVSELLRLARRLDQRIYPPATAGARITSSPSCSGVSAPCSRRTSSLFT